jgi:hypothetical protein
MTDKEKLQILLNEKELEKMGIVSKAIFTIEYDADSKRQIPKNATKAEKEEIQKRNKIAVKIRNRLLFSLKFKIVASQHLESSWIITREKLDVAIDELNKIKEEMKGFGFKNVDKRLRIIPILTTEDGYENYEEQKRQYLINFAMEHIQYCDKGLEAGRMAKSTLWRCRKAYEYITALAEELESEDAKLEVKDTNILLDDKIHLAEEMIREQEEEEERVNPKPKKKVK